MFLKPCIRLVCWLLVFGVSAAWPQQSITLQGRVLQKDTHLPLAGADVYLDNTTLGSCSVKDGSFKIKSIPSGFYRLVVSLIGYQTCTMQLTLAQNHAEMLNIDLEPKELVLKDITVTGSIDKEWQ
jgi:hypothetical protein